MFLIMVLLLVLVRFEMLLLNINQNLLLDHKKRWLFRTFVIYDERYGL